MNHGLFTKNLIDLHTHTTASDGTFTPTELVHLAKEQGLRAIAITDHDTVSGVSEGVKAGLEQGLEVIAGVEISVEYRGGEMHLLGYYVNPQSPQLQRALKDLQAHRDERNPKMVEKLQNLNIDITMDEVIQCAGGKVVGRPHMAAVMMQKGYVQSTAEAFDKYLGTGKPAYEKKEKLTPQEGIELILAADGIPVLAHPKYLGTGNLSELEEILRKLVAWGLKGLEVYYTSHDSVEKELFEKLALKYNLIVTGGTDFHGNNKPEIHLGIGLGDLRIPYRLLEDLKKARN